MQQFEEWRNNRVTRIRQQEVYSRVAVTRVVFVHIVPLGRLDQVLDLRSRERELIHQLLPLGTKGFNWRYNADGLLLYREDQNNFIDAYTQVLRFGGIEGLSAQYLGSTSGLGGSGSPLMLWADHLDSEVTEYVTNTVRVIRDVCEQEPPYAVSVGLYGVKGALISSPGFRASGITVEQNDVIAPAVIVEDAEADIPAILRPSLDVVWQSAGYPGRP
jgi:hypothetical protein